MIESNPPENNAPLLTDEDIKNVEKRLRDVKNKKEGKEPPTLHDRKCLSKSCKGGDQVVVEEWKFRGQDMVKFRCVPCDLYSTIKPLGKNGPKVKTPSCYSIPLSSLESILNESPIISSPNKNMDSTKKYNVTTEYTDADDVKHEVGTEVELTDEQAAKLDGMVEVKPEEAAAETPAGEGEQGADPAPSEEAKPEGETATPAEATPEAPADAPADEAKPEGEVAGERSSKGWAGNHKV